MALFSPPSRLPTFSTAFSRKPHFSHKPCLPLLSKKNLIYLSIRATGEADGAVGTAGSSTVTVEEKKEEVSAPTVTEVKVEEKKEEVSAAVTQVKVEEEVKKAPSKSNGVAYAAAMAVKEAEAVTAPKFENPKWVGGTWDLKQFGKDGKTDWDAVIDAEVRRRKWLQDNPESSNNDEPVVFDTSIIPWWSWVKRFHLPEAELLNGRAAMVGFFMAYLVDSLTGVGLVDQMGNIFLQNPIICCCSWCAFYSKE